MFTARGDIGDWAQSALFTRIQRCWPVSGDGRSGGSCHVAGGVSFVNRWQVSFMNRQQISFVNRQRGSFVNRQRVSFVNRQQWLGYLGWVNGA